MTKHVDETSVQTSVTEQVTANQNHTLSMAYHKPSGVHIIVDSTADFAPGVAEQLGVEVIQFPYTGPDGEKFDDGWKSASAHEFYESMRKNKQLHYKTSAVTPGHYFEVFERSAKAGIPTVYLCFPAALSSSFYAAQQAAQMIKEQYPDFELYVIDNGAPSVAAELLAIEAVHQANSGLTAHELAKWANDAHYFLHGYFTLETLDALAAGGRIPPAAANIGGKLDVKPEISYDAAGALSLKSICRGRKKALRAIIQDFRDNYSYDLSLPVAIVSADAKKDAEWVEAQLRKEKGCEGITIIQSTVGPVIGSHVGPGMVAVVFWGTDRREKLSLADKIASKVRGNKQ